MVGHGVPYLTERRERIVQRIVQCIREWITEHGEAPTVVETGQTVGLRSRASVHEQLVVSAKRGFASGRGLT
ncbi:hypothetical protein K4749_04325 [Streptomyces sp. TRM72054]|uniref:LexA family protein n=1 Tax=Streptomyces sp. TRM72054 TaxID=2870562 RepID=UPI001C8C5893|nr:hypothetical protein [Streptomyces sp. TRM72054]MBX9392832.1 hypothetical protein [Streptomyces sp. TRM72054]